MSCEHGTRETLSRFILSENFCQLWSASNKLLDHLLKNLSFHLKLAVTYPIEKNPVESTYRKPFFLLQVVIKCLMVFKISNKILIYNFKVGLAFFDMLNTLYIKISYKWIIFYAGTLNKTIVYWTHQN